MSVVTSQKLGLTNEGSQYHTEHLSPQANRLQLIMHIKNNMHLAGESTNIAEKSLEKFAIGGASYRKDGNLHFDQSRVKVSGDSKENLM